MFDFSFPRNVVVIGAGISGRSVFEFLQNRGHNVILYDDSFQKKPNIDLKNTDVVVQSPGIPFMPHNRHSILKEADVYGLPVISTFDVFISYNPNAKIISITGTNGKSTVTALVTHILQKSGIDCTMGGNIGIPFCSLPNKDWYIFEMSSYEIAISKYLKSNIACILNIKPDHMENHGSFQNYVDAKHTLLYKSDLRIISLEDKLTVSEFGNSENIIKISNTSEEADIHECEGVLFDNFTAILDLSLYSNLMGRHNHQNVAFAYAICKEVGVSPIEIKKYISSFKPLPHRMNTIRKISKVIFVNDSKATNPDSASQALDTFTGYKIYWLVGGRSKHASTECVEQYLQYIQKIYLFGESQEEFGEIFVGKKDFVKCYTIENALCAAYKDSKTDDYLSVVLFSPMCSSFDQFKNFEERGDYFCKLVSELEPQ